MTIYTDTFGGVTLPPAEYGYQALSITADTTLLWPYNSSGGTVVSKIMDVTASGLYAITLPDATQVSTGEDFLVRNVGANTITLKDSTGGTIGTVATGAASYFYLTSNATAAGTWGTIAYGVGTSTVDAATLVGYGIIAIGSTLNQAHPVTDQAAGFTLDDTYRSKLVNYTGGTGTLALTTAPTLGDNFFSLIRNSGSGVLTINPAGAETIDGQATLDLQPGESLLLFCSGTAWFSVGYGRSIVYNFSQLVLDVSAAGTFTLTAAQSSNKLLTFIGNPGSAVTIVVPNTVAVYYTLSSISTAQDITVKTAAGSGAVLPQSQRIIMICDSTNVYSATSSVSTTSLSLVDGSSAAPALNFSSSTNTGLYKYGAAGYGFSVGGVSRYSDNGTTVTIGSITGLIKRTAGVESAAVADTDYATPAYVAALALALG